MNLSALDWGIVAVVMGLMIFSVMAAKKLMRTVADFLAAGRTAGRYVVSVASGVAGLGAITIVGTMEMNLIAGFSMAWWGMTMSVVILVITVSGWVIYRFRETRCLTLAQFFEMRYSRRFRIFAGMLCFVSGLINFGIFPAVGARFFIYFCGLPHTFGVAGMEVSTFAVTMFGLLAVSIYFVLSGGQIAVIIADFFQGMFVNIVFVILILYAFFAIDWDTIQAALVAAPAEASLINPFKTSHIEDFNFWYFLIGIFGVMYNTMSWQGTQGYNASARSAHEAKMGSVLAGWRGLPQTILFLFIPIVAYTILNHVDYATIANAVSGTLDSVEAETVRSQLKVPLVLSHLLPRGLMGAFVAVMLAAFISTHDSYLHSWGSILVQDVIMPFRKKPFSKEQHLRLLRGSIIFVAGFIFCFSMLYQPSEYIFLFFAITGAIFVGGSGAVVIGGLYWRRGTTAAAWAAMITGSTIAVGGIIIHQIVDDFFINGQMFWAIGMFGAGSVYVVVSLLGRGTKFDLDRLLNRGAYARKDEQQAVDVAPSRGWRMLGMGREFTRFDRFIYIANYVWTGGWTLVFIVGTIYNLSYDVADEAWMDFWRIFLLIHVGVAVVVIVWFTVGGIRDLKDMARRLRLRSDDDADRADDGFVRRE
jgi:SSS family solute:Na+ symporter